MFEQEESTGTYCFKARIGRLSFTCYLERVLVRMQLFPLDPLIDFFLLGLGMHIDVYIPGSVQVLKFLKLVLLSQCVIFYRHNNTLKKRQENKKIFLSIMFLFSLSQVISIFSWFLTFDVLFPLKQS